MNEGDVRMVVRKHTRGRDLGFLGEPRVNVLEMNLELDTLMPCEGHDLRRGRFSESMLGS
jgi:potassium-transporting ATPase KdpC subunit